MLGTIGDLVEDVVVRLRGPINVASDTDATVIRRRGGSAANAAVAARRAGGASRFIGQVGEDPLGAMLIDELRSEGVEVAVRRRGRSGTIVVLVDASGERTMLSDRATCVELDGADPAWLDDLTTLHVPVYSLTEAPLATTTIELVAQAHERSIAVSVDASSVSVIETYGVDRLAGLLASLRPDVLLCNGAEAACLGDAALRTIDAAVTVVKRGPDPAVVLERGAAPVEVRARSLVDVTDTTGAGDAFAAGFLLALAGGAVPSAATERGHRTAADAIARASRERDAPSNG
ncbi:MAG: carbohydrate kinase family protein [Acidimicrobiia bacterium]